MLWGNHSEFSGTTGNDTTVFGNEGAEDEGADGRKLDEDVDGGSGGVLEGVANGITSDGGGVDGGSLLDDLTVDGEKTSLNVLLGVVPSATGVGGGEGNLDTGDDATSEETVGGLETEEHTGEEGGDNDEESWGNHLSEGCVGGDADAKLVIGDGGLTSLGALIHNLELATNFFEHVLGGITDGLHGHGGEPVREHGTEKETSEGEGLEDVDVVGVGPLGVALQLVGGGDTGDESTEESESDEAGGANGETLADSGSGVACGIEVVGVLTGFLVDVGHLSNSTSVVGDGTIAVNGEGNRETSEHADGGKSDTVHGGEVEGDEDSDGEAEDGHDGGKVTEGETVDDVGGGTVLASFSEFLGRPVLFGGVVLSDETDEETGPESEDDACVSLPLGGVVFLASESDSEVLGEHVDGGDDHGGHKDGGNPKLDLELELNLVGLDVGEPLAEEGSGNSDGRNNEREVDGIRGCDHVDRSGRDDEGSAGGLSEGAEKISAHTGNITNVITDVVGDGAWVLGGVFGEGGVNLASKVSTNISSLGVDTTTDSAEESDGGATEAVSGDKLEDVSGLLELSRVDGSSVAEDDDLENKKSDTNEAESEDLSTLEGALESSEFVGVAEVCSLVVADGSNDHADVATKHGGGGTNEEGEGGVGEVGTLGVGPGHVDGAKDDCGEEGAEHGECAVLFFQEGDGALKNYKF